MNSSYIFKRMTWNLIIAICFVIAIAMIAVGVVYAAATAETNEGITDTKPQSPLAIADFGDLPDNSEGESFPVSYDGLTVPTGAVHTPDNNNRLHLGRIVDTEDFGQTDEYAGSGLTGGDDNNSEIPGGPDDEDGVTRGTSYWTNGATVVLNVEVSDCEGTCYLNGWIDWGLDGSFVPLDPNDPNDPNQFDQVFTNTHVIGDLTFTNTLTIQVPAAAFYTEGSPVYSRFRLCRSDVVGTPESCNELTGLTNNGEVEDYWWDFGPTAIELVSIEANTNSAVPFALLAGSVILLISGGAILTFKRRRV